MIEIERSAGFSTDAPWLFQKMGNSADLSGRGRCFRLLPIALGRFDHEPLLDGGSGNPDIANLSVHNGFDPLEIREEPALRDGGDVGADTAALLGFTTAPNDAALHWALTGQFANSCHTGPGFKN